MSDYKSTGKTCSLCGWHDHYDYHHRDAVCEALREQVAIHALVAAAESAAVNRNEERGGGLGFGLPEIENVTLVRSVGDVLLGSLDSLRGRAGAGDPDVLAVGEL